MRYGLFFLSLITLAACSSESEQSSTYGDRKAERTGNSSASETFNEFYNTFSSDSAYQVSHIIFPLHVESYDPVANSMTNSIMNAKEWEYMDFDLKKPYILKIKSGKDTVNVNIQKEETGIYVDYLFTPVNSKWVLVKIVDQST